MPPIAEDMELLLRSKECVSQFGFARIAGNLLNKEKLKKNFSAVILAAIPGTTNRKGLMLMKSEQFQRQKNYSIQIAILDNLLLNGLITKEERDEAERKTRSKEKPLIIQFDPF